MLAGDVVAKAITFAISLVLLNVLAPGEYITFGLFMTVVAIVVQFSDSGLNQSFIRFFSLYKDTNPARANAHLHFAARFKLGIFVLLGVALYFTASIISSSLDHPELTSGIQLLAIGLTGIGIFEFSLSVQQARQEFTRMAVLRVAEAVLKIGFILVFIVQGTFTLTNVYQAYSFVPIAVALFILFGTNIFRVKEQYSTKEIGSELLGFGKWVAFSSFATMFLQHIDTLIAAKLLPDADAGIYYAARRLCIPLQVLTGSIVTVFFPKAMALQSLDDLRKYIRSSFKVSVPVAALTVLYLIAVLLAVPVFFPAYTDSIPLIIVLYFGWIWTLVGNPITILLLSLNRANVATYISFGQLIVTGVMHWYFATYFGAMGVAVSSLFVWLLAGCVTYAFIYKYRHQIETVRKD